MVFGLVKGPEHPVAVHVQLTAVPADQAVEIVQTGPVPGADGTRPGWLVRFSHAPLLPRRIQIARPRADQFPGPVRLPV